MDIVNSLEHRVTRSLERAGYAAAEITLVVGASGGPDSTALLRCLHRLSDSHPWRLHVAHLNHDFRGDEADADADFVRDLAGNLGLPCTIEKEDPIAYQQAQGISSFEQGARELRYRFLAKVAGTVGAPVAAVGHTGDDLAETVLLHLLRGTGLHGLQGMVEVAPWPWPGEVQPLSLYRPLLEVTKAETTEYCRVLGQEFRLDTGNLMFRFTRNRMRQELLPLLAAEYNPRVREALVRLARTSALELDYLEGEVDRVWPQVVSEELPGIAVRFHRTTLHGLHPLLQRLVLRRGYTYLVGDSRRLAEAHLIAMSSLLDRDEQNRTLHLPRGIQVRSQDQELTIGYPDATREPKLPLLKQPHRLLLPERTEEELVQELEGWQVSCRLVPVPLRESLLAADAYTAYLRADVLPSQLQVRTRRPGDRFQPLGMAREKKLQDFFTDARVPRQLRDQVPIVTSERGILWVVGHRIADWVKINPEDGSAAAAMLLTFRPAPGNG